MADTKVYINGLAIKAKDLGDGTFALVVRDTINIALINAQIVGGR